MDVHENPFRVSRVATDKETDFRQMLQKGRQRGKRISQEDETLVCWKGRQRENETDGR